MIELATLKDLDSILNIECDSHSQYTHQGWSRQNFLDEYNQSHVRIYIYKYNTQTIGFAVIHLDEYSSQGEIVNIAIAKEYHKQGHGYKFIDYLMNIIFPKFLNKLHTVILDVAENNISAINLYKAFGFKTIHIRQNYYKNQINGLVMQYSASQ